MLVPATGAELQRVMDQFNAEGAALFVSLCPGTRVVVPDGRPLVIDSPAYTYVECAETTSPPSCTLDGGFMKTLVAVTSPMGVVDLVGIELKARRGWLHASHSAHCKYKTKLLTAFSAQSGSIDGSSALSVADGAAVLVVSCSLARNTRAADPPPRSSETSSTSNGELALRANCFSAKCAVALVTLLSSVACCALLFLIVAACGVGFAQRRAARRRGAAAPGGAPSPRARRASALLHGAAYKLWEKAEDAPASPSAQPSAVAAAV